MGHSIEDQVGDDKSSSSFRPRNIHIEPDCNRPPYATEKNTIQLPKEKMTMMAVPRERDGAKTVQLFVK